MDLFDLLPINIAIIGSNGIIIKSNKAWVSSIEKIDTFNNLQIGANFLDVFDIKNVMSPSFQKQTLADINKVFDKSLAHLQFKYRFIHNNENKYILMKAVLLQQDIYKLEPFLVITHEGGIHNEENFIETINIDDRVKKFTDLTNSLFFVLNEGNQIIHCNSSWEIFTGLGTANDDNQSWKNMIHPDDESLFTNILVQNKHSQSTSKLNLRFKNANNEYIWFNINCVYLADISCIMVYCIDIEELMGTKQYLKTTLKKLSFYRLALDQFASISILDNNGNFSYLNYNFCKVSQFTKKELIGKHFNMLQPYMPSENLDDLFNNELSKGNSCKSDIKYIAKDGRDFWLDLTVTPITDSVGKIIEYISIGYDITSRKTAETELLNSKNLLEQTGKFSNIGGMSYDLQSDKLLLTNETYKILHLHQACTVDLAFIKNLFAQNLIDIFGVEVENCLKFGRQWDIELQLNKSAHNHIWIRSIGKPNYENGKITGFLSIIKDVLKSKEFDIELKNVTNDLVFKNKELIQFSYIVSHNMRAPVANILGLTSILNVDECSEENKKTLKYIEGAAQSLNETINDLNNILSIKNSVIHREEIDLKDILQSTISILDTNIKESQVDITCDFNCQNSVFLLKSFLKSIFYNLLSNAIKYKNPTRMLKIHVESSVIDNYIKISFKDNGLGIDIEFYKDKLFGMYKRFHNHVGGKGLGLFIVKNQVEAMDGYIEWHSIIDVGSEFCIYFKKPN